FLSAHIWKMEFYGNSYYTDERLTKYLDTVEGISFGIWKTKVDGPLLEENLRLTFPDISWVSVRMEGTSLIVALEEMVKYDASAREQELPRYALQRRRNRIYGHPERRS
ncbi:MAG: sporulation protein YqfD, partial [Frisingicoccus sp.]